MKEGMRRKLAIVLAALIVSFGLCFVQPVWAVEAETVDVGTVEAGAANPETVETGIGAQVFEVHCVGCHINGGNIVRRGKNLKLKALQHNKVDSIEAIGQLVTNGKGIMSAYGDRLTSSEIEAVAAYVLEQAKQGWKS